MGVGTTTAAKLSHRAVKDVVSHGLIERPDCCSRCGSDRSVVAHHDDYTKPLDITWLCRKCHARRHRELGWGVGHERHDLAPGPGTTIRTRRRELGISQLDLAERAGIPRPSLSAIEAGRLVLTHARASALASLLSINVELLLEEAA